MEDILCSSQADVNAYEFQWPNTQQEWLWAKVNEHTCRTSDVSIFKIPSPLTSINLDLWHFFRKLRPEKSFNLSLVLVGCSEIGAGCEPSQTSASRAGCHF